MDYKAIGLKTGKVYVIGSKADCLRTLHELFPTKEEHHYFRKGVDTNRVLPEVILITKYG